MTQATVLQVCALAARSFAEASYGRHQHRTRPGIHIQIATATQKHVHANKRHRNLNARTAELSDIRPSWQGKIARGRSSGIHVSTGSQNPWRTTRLSPAASLLNASVPTAVCHESFGWADIEHSGPAPTALDPKPAAR